MTVEARMRVRLSAAVAAGCGAFVLVARDASGLDPVDLEVAALGSYGTNPSTSGPANPLAFGAGARAGASMLGLYAGADFASYFGTGSSRRYDERYDEKVTQHAVRIGGQVGYSFHAAFVTIRPRLGAGDLVVTTTATRIGTPCPCNVLVVPPVLPSTQSDLYLEGSVGAFVPIHPLDPVFVGIDAELLVLPNPTAGQCCDQLETAFTFDGQVGLRF